MSSAISPAQDVRAVKAMVLVVDDPHLTNTKGRPG
jgi:hypothetical protein